MNIEEIFIKNIALSAEDIEKFKINIKSQNLIDWDDIMEILKYVVEQAIKADRINLLEHAEAKQNHSDYGTGEIWVDKKSITNAPNIELL